MQEKKTDSDTMKQKQNPAKISSSGGISASTRRRLQIAVLATGIVMMLIGAARGEIGTVFLKATNICLECIGIG